jgi:hypothetical protein
LLVIAALAVVGPRTMDGLAALEWTRYHAGRVASARRPLDEATRLGRWASRAVERLAPLPWAAEAARLALDAAPADRRSARAALDPLAAALERVSRGWVRGLGLGGILEEARRRQQALAAEPAS